MVAEEIWDVKKVIITKNCNRFIEKKCYMINLYCFAT